MLTHCISFLLGFLLDQLFGDPYWLPHPIRLIGSWIHFLENRFLRKKEEKQKEFQKGILLVFFVLLATGITTFVVLYISYQIHIVVGIVVESIMCYQILAAKCLKVESMKVYQKLKEGDLPEARKAVSMIVGRDTDCLDETGVAKAAIETVAENTSDGVIAPMLFMAIGGPVLGFLYKAVNTMDSMVGYKKERYFYFGRAAAKLDDAVNFIPARISAWLMITVSYLFGKAYSGADAKRIFYRDRFHHASPNSAQTEAVCAGALGIRLAGDASYFGKVVKKPYIGDEMRSVEYEDIARSNHLMYGAAWLCELVCLCIMVGIIFVTR